MPNKMIIMVDVYEKHIKEEVAKVKTLVGDKN